ncbi:MAG: adenylate/guanylate cyclase domain-containing protein [Spirochaetes bacterium]|nr:adenylate/guanylate cyclase domain-containing protein [Spirochaetota bacterium]
MFKNLFKILQEFIEKKGFSGLLIAILSFILIMLLSFTDFYETFELRLYDIKFKIKPSISEWSDLIFLDIDDKSISNIGKYPWPRHYYASALAVLKEIGVRQVTFDMEFPDPSPKEVDLNTLNILRVKAEKKARIDADELKNIVLDNDNIFAESVKSFRKVIIPYHFQKDTIEYYDVSEEYIDEIKKARELFTSISSAAIPKEKINDFNSMVDPDIIDIAVPIPRLINSAYRFGFTDSEFDADGVARKKRLIRVFQGRVYFDLGLVMLMDLCGVEKENVIINVGKNIILKDAINPMTFIKKDIAIPIDENGRMYINWAGPGPYTESFKPHVHFDAILEYPDIKNEIHDFFDEQEIASGSKERSKQYGELEKKYKEFKNTSDLNSKKDIGKQIYEINSKILKIEQGYRSVLTNEIESVKEKLKNNKNSELEEYLSGLNNYLKGVNIVLLVESLRNKVCIAGLVAIGTQDIGATPTNNEYWMVGSYHNIVNTVLNESFIVKIGRPANLLIIVILALIMGMTVQRLAARTSLLSIAAGLIIINLINIGLFAFFNIWFDQLGANLAVFVPSFIIAGMKLMKEEGQKRYIKSAFSRYLAPTVIEKIIESPKALELGGEEQNISIFFSDIAKFSTISEKLTPPELVKLLNEYLSEMTNIILSYGGTVDKYIGDAIMAFYGAPLSYEDHASRCCHAAIDMKKRLRDLQDYWRESGSDILKVRMGINSGKAVVGNMGSSTQMGYTAMGDAVNLASRLEGVNKAYSTYAMISESTYQYVKDEIEVRKLDTVRVVGKEEPIIIYELLGEKGKLPDRMYAMLEKYYKALECFGERDWKGAITYFQQGLKIVDDDGPSLVYIERCEKYIRRAPSKDWDGVYKLTSK